MPRLGNDDYNANMPQDNDDDEMRPFRRQPASAYPARFPQTLAYAVVVFLALFWILPNVFFRDYRQEALASLQASGKTEEQIEQWFPKSLREKRQEQLKSTKALQDEVQELQKRLAELEEYVHMPPRAVTETSPP